MKLKENGIMILLMFYPLYVWLYDKVFVIDKFILIIESSPVSLPMYLFLWLVGFPSKKDQHGGISAPLTGNKQALNS